MNAEHRLKLVPFLKLGIEQGQIPHILYKYTTIDTLKLILEHQTIRFSSIKEFNDIRECFAVMDFNCSKKEWFQYIIGINPNMPPKTALTIATNLFLHPEKGKKWLTTAINSTNENLGILCLSTTENNNLMWAHYADSHSGVCLEFDISKDLETFCFPKAIQYDDKIREYNYVKSWIQRKDITAIEAIFHKSSEWSYENEWRIVRIDGVGNAKFKMESLSSICFGNCTPTDKIKEIRDYCSTKGYNHIVFKKLTINNNNGELVIIPI